MYESLAHGRTVVRYDKAGCGLSGAAARVPSMELEMETLDAVVRAVGASRFDLYGASLGAAVAAAWTAEHPARVARLVLYGGWVRGADIAARPVREHVLGLVAEHWGLGSDVLADIFAPDADAATRTAFARYQREAATPQIARAMLALAYDIDITDLLANVQAPTLVLHRDHDRAAPLEQGRALAAGIPGARLDVLAGRNHLPYIGDSDCHRASRPELSRAVAAAICPRRVGDKTPVRGRATGRPGADEQGHRRSAWYQRALCGVACGAHPKSAGFPLAVPDRGLDRGRRSLRR